MNYKKAYFCVCTPTNNNIVTEIEIRANQGKYMFYNN